MFVDMVLLHVKILSGVERDGSLQGIEPPVNGYTSSLSLCNGLTVPFSSPSADAQNPYSPSC
jgi:hypothetical protein